MKKDLLSIFDLSAAEVWSIWALAGKLKSRGGVVDILHGKTLGMIFEKPSTRTFTSFAVAMYQLGGMPLMMDARNLQRKRGESIADTALTLSRYLDGIMIRAIHHEDVMEFAKHSQIPIISGLTDLEHPCQVLGDIFTLIEKRSIKGPEQLKKAKVVFVGDGNNMSNSWLAAAGLMGFHFVLARPKGYGPDAAILKKAQALAKVSGGRIEIVEDPLKAVKGADVIYTDVWISMGDEGEQDKRRKAFKPYQINQKLVGLAKKDVMVMHCLPAVRGEEITDAVMDGPNSVIFDEAENRLHIQKAILVYLLK